MSVINKIVFQNVTLKVLLEEEGTNYFIVEALRHKIRIPRKHFPFPLFFVWPLSNPKGGEGKTTLFKPGQQTIHPSQEFI